MCLDGNFRLCRRKKAGQRTLNSKPLYKSEVFADQCDVDEYLRKSSSAVQSSGAEGGQLQVM